MHESQGREFSGQKQCPEQGLEASSPAKGIPPRSDFQCGSPPPSLSYSVEARLGDLHP